jgi:hypothetical protein
MLTDAFLKLNYRVKGAGMREPHAGACGYLFTLSRTRGGRSGGGTHK